VGSCADATVREVAMLRRGKEPKAKKSVAVALMRDMQGTASWSGASRLICPPVSERSEIMPKSLLARGDEVIE
jgi:hypothetical protein